MKQFKPDYVAGATDNYKRLKKQLGALNWWQFSKCSKVKTMMTLAIMTDYQQTMSNIHRSEIELKGGIKDCFRNRK